MRTKTIKDLHQTMEEVDWACYIYGATLEFILEYKGRIANIQGKLCWEMAIEPNVASSLPMDAPLTPVAEEKFLALIEWLCSQNQQFTDLYCRMSAEIDEEAVQSLAEDPHLL